MQEKVDYLKKITLSVEAGTGPDTMDVTDGPVTAAFIFGIDKTGLTPFEQRLLDHRAGDTLSLTVRRKELAPYFGDIALPVPTFPEQQDNIYLNIRILDVSPASGRDVIRAMAERVQDCACGCGCGGHGHGTHDCHGEDGCAPAVRQQCGCEK